MTFIEINNDQNFWMRTRVGIINRNKHVNKATMLTVADNQMLRCASVALFTFWFRLIIPTLVRIQKFWSLFISINVTKIYEYAKFWADRLHWGWMAASATPTSKTTNPPVPVVWWYLGYAACISLRRSQVFFYLLQFNLHCTSPFQIDFDKTTFQYESCQIW